MTICTYFRLKFLEIKKKKSNSYWNVYAVDMNDSQILQLVEERHAITFLGNQNYDYALIYIGRTKP